jgi:hypothetical protein
MITLPVTDVSKGGAQFDAGACIKAVTVLGLKASVQVKWSAGQRRLGSHRWRDGVHVITVSTYSDAERASKTLWHELAHAHQVERIGWETYYPAYKAYGKSGTKGYKSNPYEVEASKIEEDFHAVLSLTKGA